MTDIPPQKPDDPRGWLTFDGVLPPDLDRAEAQTQAADYDWLMTRQYDTWVMRGRALWRRHATPTEVALLQQLGYQLPDEQLWTYVEYTAPSVRWRYWPQLESQTPNPTTGG